VSVCVEQQTNHTAVGNSIGTSPYSAPACDKAEEALRRELFITRLTHTHTCIKIPWCCSLACSPPVPSLASENKKETTGAGTRRGESGVQNRHGFVTNGQLCSFSFSFLFGFVFLLIIVRYVLLFAATEGQGQLQNRREDCPDSCRSEEKGRKKSVLRREHEMRDKGETCRRADMQKKKKKKNHSASTLHIMREYPARSDDSAGSDNADTLQLCPVRFLAFFSGGRPFRAHT